MSVVSLARAAGLTALRSNKGEAALELINRALEKTGPVAELLDTRGVIYLTMGKGEEALAGWLYWRTDGETRGFAAYGVGLLANLLWTPLFFEGGAAGAALVDILVLDVVVLVTIVLFGRRSRAAAAPRPCIASTNATSCNTT